MDNETINRLRLESEIDYLRQQGSTAARWAVVDNRQLVLENDNLRQRLDEATRLLEAWIRQNKPVPLEYKPRKPRKH